MAHKDTGANVSPVALACVDRALHTHYFYHNVAQSRFHLFGSRTLILDIDLKQAFTWIFVVAELPDLSSGLTSFIYSTSTLTQVDNAY